MKIAFVHDWIINIWWAENVFFDIVKKELDKTKSDNIKIFTLFSNKKEVTINNITIPIISIISNDFILNKVWYRNLMPFFSILIKLLWYKIKKFNPDKTVISSFAIAKNIWEQKYSELYLHSPNQYIRSHYNEYLEKFWLFKKTLYKITSCILRKQDKKHTKFNKIYFNSKYTKSLAAKIYWIQWKVKYPKIDEKFINTLPANTIDNYYIFLGRTVRFVKELDKIVDLFSQLNENLLIVWNWPDKEYIKSISTQNIFFIEYVDNIEEKIKILSKSKWLINITKESFWIVTAESLALGVPVFGYNDWATPELVDKRSWILVQDKQRKTLLKQFQNFSNKNFDRWKIKSNFLEKYKKDYLDNI